MSEKKSIPTKNIKKRKRIPRHAPFYYARIKHGIAAAFLAVLLAGALALFSYIKAGTMTDQQAAQRWEKEEAYAQISVFFPSDAPMDTQDTTAVKAILLQALAADSIIPPDTERDRMPVNDCWSISGMTQVQAGSVSVSAEAVHTGGGFFVFHPVQLLSGSYYLSDNLMQDQILLDEQTAWTLFGAYEVEGRTVTIEERNYVVAGVFKRQSFGFPIRTEEEKPLVFLPYVTPQTASTAAASSGEGTDSSSGQTDHTWDTQEITCYEMLVPNPVEGYAAGKVLNAVGREDTQVVCVDNTARYTRMGLLGKLRSLGTWGTRTSPVRFPYWENAAVSLEEILSLLLAAQILLVLLAVISVVKVIVFIYNNRRWSLTGSIHALQETVYRKQSERLYPEYYAEQKREAEKSKEEQD